MLPKFSLLLAVCLFCSADVVWGALTTITAINRQLINEVYHVFNNSDQLSLCVVIPDDSDDVRDVVIQPGAELGVPRTGGEFRVEDAFIDAFSVTTQSCKVQCPDPLGNFSTCVTNGTGCCFEHNGTRPECDQLVFRPSLVGARRPIDGQIRIQYVPQGMLDSPINVTLRFGSPGIFFNEDNSIPIEINDMSEVTLNFTRWQLQTPFSQDQTTCEILDGSSMNSVKLTVKAGLQTDNTCFVPFADVVVPLVSRIRADVNINSLTPGTTCRVFLSPGACQNANTEENVTIIVPPATTTAITPITPAVTTGAEETTMPPATEGGVPLLIIIVVACIVGALVLAGVIIVVCVCYFCVRRNSNRPDAEEVKGIEMKSLNEGETFDPEEGKVADKKPGDSARNRLNNDYIQLSIPIATVTSVAPPPTSAASLPKGAVSSVAFVTAGGSPNYQRLEEEILTQHSCERSQPVAMGGNGHTPTFDEYWCWISKLLKKECNLVYVIWSMALENVNGMQNPPIKKLVTSLVDRPLKITDAHGSRSVMHRLVFLQLGSKGNVHSLLSSLKSLTVFWNISAEDDAFDAKQCARSVCKKVRERLEAHQNTKNLNKNGDLKPGYGKQSLKTGRALEGVDGNTLHQSKSMDTLGPQDTSKTSLDPPHLSLDPLAIDRLGDRIGHRIGGMLLDEKHGLGAKLQEQSESQHKELKQTMNSVEAKVEFMADKKMQGDF